MASALKTHPVIKPRLVVRRGMLDSTPPKAKGTYVEIDEALFFAVREQLNRHRTTLRELVEWSCKQFLVDTDPEGAARIGIRPED